MVGEASSRKRPTTRRQSAASNAAGRTEGLDPHGAPAARDREAWRVRLYDLDDVRAAMGPAAGYGPPSTPASIAWEGDVPERVAEDTEHQGRLRAILQAGEEARWRGLVDPTPEIHEAVGELGSRAPHMDGLTRLVRLNLLAALNMAVPTFLEPVLLLGPPGIGKTWFLAHLGKVLGVPFRSYPMSASTLGEGLSGSHPSWRNAAPGLVAKTLLREPVANPVIFVDEVDKVQVHSHNSDPYRPFYTLLEPSASRGFCDEYLGFGLDASRVLWILAANDESVIPRAIVDRLTVIEVPDMTREHRLVVAESVYAEANEARRHFFGGIPGPVQERLATLAPRSARLAVEHAMARAAADGRRALQEDDVRPRTSRERARIGFR